MDDPSAYDADILPRLPTDRWPTLRTQADLHRQWRALRGPLGFGFRRLWLLFLHQLAAHLPDVLSVRAAVV